MTRCDVCNADATVLVACKSNAQGGDAAYGSFKGYRCDAHGREAIAAHEAAGFAVKVYPLVQYDERDNMGDEAGARHHEAAA